MDIELNEDPKDSFLKSLARFLQQRVDFLLYGGRGMSPKHVIFEACKYPNWSRFRFGGKNQSAFPSSVQEILLH